MKASLQLVVLLAGFILVTLSACTPVYVPNAVQAPLLEERGDIRVGGYVGTSGADLQVAGALTDHLGVSAAVLTGSYEDESEDAVRDENRRRFGEVGIGYFTDFGRVGRFEVYGGYGRGWAEATDEYRFLDNRTVTATGRYRRLFVQPTLGAALGPARLYGATRLAHVRFHEFETSQTTFDEAQSAPFFEPTVGADLGLGWFNLGGQIGLSIPLENEENFDFDHQPMWISLGVQVRLNGMTR